MASFLDWVTDNVDRVGTKKFDKLNSVQQQALLNALLSTSDEQLTKRLSRKGIELTRDGGDVLVKQGRSVLGKLRSVRVGSHFLGRLATGVGIYFFINAAADAKASGSNNAAALLTGMRELVDADMWEAGFHMSVVSGSETLWEGAVPSAVSSRPTARRLWPFLSEGERRNIIERYSRVQFEGIYKSTGASNVSLRDALNELWNSLPD